MKTVTLKFSDDRAQRVAYFLRRLYGRDGRTTLRQLCEMAVNSEVARQAEIDATEAVAALAE